MTLKQRARNWWHLKSYMHEWSTVAISLAAYQAGYLACLRYQSKKRKAKGKKK